MPYPHFAGLPQELAPSAKSDPIRASPEIAHEDVAVRRLTLGYDGKTLILVTHPHVTPRLYRLELKGLRAADGRELADGLVYLTVHWLPGEVTEPKSNW